MNNILNPLHYGEWCELYTLLLYPMQVNNKQCKYLGNRNMIHYGEWSELYTLLLYPMQVNNIRCELYTKNISVKL